MCWEHILTSYKIKLSVNKNLGALPSTTRLEEFFVSFFTVKKEKKSEGCFFSKEILMLSEVRS